MYKRVLLAAVLLSFSLMLGAEELKTIKLPPPRLDGGKSLMHALKDRASQRSFSPGMLPAETLSSLLWAACGINRPGSGKRTAPSAMNRQEIDVYVATAGGLYLYDPRDHALVPVLARDIRALTGRQPYVSEAPVNLVYVADLKRMGDMPPEEKTVFSSADAGFIAQNVYLFCASEGLAAVVRGAIDKEALAKAMKLTRDQKIILAQTLGYPKE